MDFTGLFPAATTKLTETGALDLAACSASYERMIEAGVSAIIVLPMLGENPCMSLEEKEKVVRNAIETANGRVPVLSGLAEVTIDDATAAAKRYQSWGAAGLMAFPSTGYKTDRRETETWYRKLGAATDLPIMIYNNPIAYKVDVTPEMMASLADVDTLVAFKEETGDIRRVTDIYNTVGNRYKVFCGVDDLILESVALGVDGWVSGMTNAFPNECVKLLNLLNAGKFAEALVLYRLLTPAFHLDTDVKLVQYIKLAEHIVSGAPEWVRSPRLPLEGEERAHVSKVINDTLVALKAL
ncbi:dihydrodipicolinate synthase family protein [Mariluticola halotolerans]|uniref:dihydrodipicolinate synthase family protein n=1 Tax=Mariluticola halotolerans TaxID=2909283 RepID=UPI0026E367D7|nr:dihydrodipicolinate synthase family protein [Mariluticola halotolerans]UJQ93243.1 dihydrodipicolinate synthase family protein [Mariluticola halotolerans]